MPPYLAKKAAHTKGGSFVWRYISHLTTRASQQSSLWLSPHFAIPARFSAPKIHFVTRYAHVPNNFRLVHPTLFLHRIYHMNISDRGAVCIDILKNQWSPALSIFKVVLSLSSLLMDPNPRERSIFMSPPCLLTEVSHLRLISRGSAW